MNELLLAWVRLNGIREGNMEDNMMKSIAAKIHGACAFEPGQATGLFECVQRSDLTAESKAILSAALDQRLVAGAGMGLGLAGKGVSTKPQLLVCLDAYLTS